MRAALFMVGGISLTVSLWAANFSASLLPARSLAPTGSRLFTVLSPTETGVNGFNVFNDPRMWGARFRELTLGAVETGVAVADFDRDGRPDIFLFRKMARARFIGRSRPSNSPTLRRLPV